MRGAQLPPRSCLPVEETGAKSLDFVSKCGSLEDTSPAEQSAWMNGSLCMQDDGCNCTLPSQGFFIGSSLDHP